MNDLSKRYLDEAVMLPPNVLDTEVSVLGIYLVYPDSVNEIRLTSNMFCKDSHRKIFDSIKEPANRGKCDIITVNEHLRRCGQLESIGGPVVLTMLTSGIITDQMIDTHALIVKQAYIAMIY